MEELTKDLYVVKPALVLSEKIIREKKYKERKMDILQIIKFEVNPENVTIALKKANFFKELFGERIYLNSIGLDYSGKEFYVFDEQQILLSRYLWQINTKTKFLDAFENYINYLKPYYTHEELKEILKGIKNEVARERTVSFKRKLRYELPLDIN